MTAIISLLIILTIALTAVRVGAIALEFTGLSYEVAAFQAQSAFSGAGFTTSESESIVTHAVRRKIIRILILVGNVGLVSTGATLIVAMTDFTSRNIATRAPVLVVSLLLIYLASRSKIVYRVMKKTILSILSRSKTLQLQDYHDMLGISNGYSISRMRVQQDNWQVGKSLKELALQKEGTLLLSIVRRINEKEITILPNGGTVIQAEDRLTAYGRDVAMNCLFMRHAGEKGDKIHQIRTQQHNVIQQLGSAENYIFE